MWNSPQEPMTIIRVVSIELLHCTALHCSSPMVVSIKHVVTKNTKYQGRAYLIYFLKYIKPMGR